MWSNLREDTILAWKGATRSRKLTIQINRIKLQIMDSEKLPAALEKGNADLQRLFEIIEAKAAVGDPTCEADILRYTALSDQFMAKIEDEQKETYRKKFLLDIETGKLNEARECYKKLLELDPDGHNGYKLFKLMLERMEHRKLFMQQLRCDSGSA